MYAPWTSPESRLTPPVPQMTAPEMVRLAEQPSLQPSHYVDDIYCLNSQEDDQVSTDTGHSQYQYDRGADDECSLPWNFRSCKFS